MEAAATVLHPGGTELFATARLSERRVAWLYVGTGLTLFCAMGLAGLTMRLEQAEVITLSPSWFYRLMTLHGAGMLVGALLAMMGALTFVLRTTVPLHLGRMLAAYLAIVGGAVLVVIAVLFGGFASGWTFLWPLPFDSFGAWQPWATDTFLVGMLLVGAGFFVFCLDLLLQTTAAYGGLQRALGISYLRNRDDSPPPPAAIAAMVVSIEGLLAGAAGTTIVVALIGHAIDSGLQLDALWAKNLTYFFGHSIANLIIYLGAGAVYVLLPGYTGRPWKTTKPIVVAWLFTLLFVATAYSHHLYMDFVQPEWAQGISSVASYGAALPPAVVTIFTGAVLVWGSRYRWTLASTLLYLGFMGWAIGGTGAVIDSLIPINFRFHNTLWVPAHFHTYLLMGVMFWAFALFVRMLEENAGQTAREGVSAFVLGALLVGGYGFLAVWYVSGVLGVPRRWAVHPDGTAGYSLVASIFVIVFAVGVLVLLAECLRLARIASVYRWERVLPSQRPLPAPTAPEPMLTTGFQFAAVSAAAIVFLASFAPPITEATESSVRYHHLQHAAQFLVGLLVGAAFASTPAVFARLRHLTSLGIVVVILAPAAMLLVMLPSIYESFESNDWVHLLYHLGITALGVVTGLAAGTLGLVVGRLVLVLSIGMALMYAAGATGG
ncbi:MAG TPA: cbb3-type cytochrome c oxidase subunit I [Gaiella sp.]|nr:cbb3-type cytochrome c oxidase subunit I [Gaiella sp.]